MDTSLENNEMTQDTDIRQLAMRYLTYWKWILLSIILFIGAGYYYLLRQAPIYTSYASVLLKENNQSSSENLLLNELAPNSFSNSIMDEIALMKSPDLAVKVVTSLELYTRYWTMETYGIRPVELYKNAPLYVRWENIEPEKIPVGVHFSFTPIQGNGYQVSLSYNEETYNQQIKEFPAFVEVPIGKFYITKNSSFAQDSLQMNSIPFEATITNPKWIAKSYASSLTLKQESESGSVLNMQMSSLHPQIGIDYLTKLVEIYNTEAIEDKNTIARNTAIFIDERIKDITGEVDTVESRVESFKLSHQITDITSQAEMYMGKSNANQEQISQVETQLDLIRFVEDFIKRPENDRKLIPNLGIVDQGLVAVINEYNQAQLRKERLETSSSDENPVLIQMRESVNGMRQNITLSLANVRKATELQLQSLKQDVAIANAQLQRIPTIERNFKDIQRQQEVKNGLLVFLLQKREETALTLAAVAPKARIITKASSNFVPVAPDGRKILGLFALIGFIVPLLIVYVLELMHTKISSMDDLDALKDIDVIGDIPHIKIKGKSSLIVTENNDSPEVELFRSLRNNLLYTLNGNDKKVLLVTSTIPGEGKTFIAINVAKSLSLMGKKVLLLGADIRNPRLSSDLGIMKRQHGLSTYLAGLSSDYTELVEKVDKNFYVFPAGAVPPNPNELLANEILGELIEKLKKEYDYIVVDTAPIGVVSDTLVIAKVADATLYVMREGVTQKDSISYLNSIRRDNRLFHIAVVLNGASLKNKRYGSLKQYKYSYRYGYNNRYVHYGYHK